MPSVLSILEGAAAMDAGHPLVDARLLRLGDALELPLLPEVGRELGKDTQHIEEALAGRGAGVDRLLGRLQSGALGLNRTRDVLQVTYTAGQTFRSASPSERRPLRRKSITVRSSSRPAVVVPLSDRITLHPARVGRARNRNAFSP